MTTAPKLKVSLSLSADVVALVDRTARSGNDTRSAVIERWLRRAATAAAEKEVAHATAAYYESLRTDERADEEALSRGLSRAARRVSYDDAPTARRRRARR
jgi:thioesterase domain-containing protein